MVYRETCDLVIVGGGATGVFAALAAGPSGQKIRILEKDKRPLRKVQAAGDGRCNVGNVHLGGDCYDHGGEPLVKNLLATYDADAFHRFWHHLGIPLYTDERGRLYPETLEAPAVVQGLLLALADFANVRLKLQTTVTAIKPIAKGYEVITDDGIYEAPQVIFAAGSPASPQLGAVDPFPLLAPFGIETKPFLPAIAPLKVADNAIAPLKGLRLLRELRLYVDDVLTNRVTDDVLFINGAISGTAAFSLAAEAESALAQGKQVALGLVVKEDAPTSLPERLHSPLAKRRLLDFLNGYLPKALAKVLVKKAGFTNMDQPANTYDDALWEHLTALLAEWRLPLLPLNDFTKAQAAQGGVSLNEIDQATLALKKMPGVYVAGEALDVTGICGGYNLTWAYLTGTLAGQQAVQS